MCDAKTSHSQSPANLIKSHNRKLSWQNRFRRQLYKKNFLLIYQYESNSSREKKQQNLQFADENRSEALISHSENCQQKNKAVQRLIQNFFFGDDQFRQDKSLSYSTNFNNYYVYIPLRQNLELGNQIINTFSHFKNIHESGSKQQLLCKIYDEIQRFTKKCKKQFGYKGIQRAWSVCLNKFIPKIDIIKCIEVYAHLLKYGKSSIKRIHKDIDQECSKNIFQQKVLSSSKYFGSHNNQNYHMNRSIRISVQTSDEVNQVTMSKTMKMLYCSICLMYDCGRHRLDQLTHDKIYQYVAYKNVVPENQSTRKALILCNFLRKMNQKRSNVPLESQSEMVQNSINYDNSTREQLTCSKYCYKCLDLKKYKNLCLNKHLTLSPVVLSIIKIGIQMFSYDPCLIANLLIEKIYISNKDVQSQELSIKQMFKQIQNQNINCSVVFCYLTDQCLLQEKLTEHKLYRNQRQLLLREYSSINIFTNQVKKFRNLQTSKNLKKKRRRAKSHLLSNSRPQNTQRIKPFSHQQQNQQIALCFHHFVDSQSIDILCQNCECVNRGFCLPQCQCSESCPLMVLGCTCKGKEECRTQKCWCYKNKRECIPQLCSHCFKKQRSNKKNSCANQQITNGKIRNILIGPSTIQNADFGAFAGENIDSGDLVAIYCGEIVQQQIEGIRQIMKKDDTFYNFACFEGCIDARFMGNKSRFINHASDKEGKANLVSLNVYSQGQEHIALYAQKQIKVGEELFFDYDGQGWLANNHGMVYPFMQNNAEYYAPNSQIK